MNKSHFDRSFTEEELWSLIVQSDLFGKLTTPEAHSLLYCIQDIELYIEVTYPADHTLNKSIVVVEDLDRIAAFVEFDPSILFSPK